MYLKQYVKVNAACLGQSTERIKAQREERERERERFSFHAALLRERERASEKSRRENFFAK